MHYRLLITFTSPADADSSEVRREVYNQLIDDDSFCGEGGRFGSPMCDWFVIGGRWSGYLRETLIGDRYRETLNQRFPKLAGRYYSEADAKAHAPALNALWRKFGGAGRSPFNRSSYEQLGYGDDALPVDRAVYDRFLAKYRGESDRRVSSDRFTDLDGEEVDETFIGRKWIAVVDYHN
jgi:hypothetical protein